MKNHLSTNGFTLTEFLIATFIIVFAATTSFFALASASKMAGHRDHRYQAYGYAAETLDILKNYVTSNTTLPQYHLTGDDPASNCSTGSAGRYALLQVFDSPMGSNPGGAGHCHPLPTGVGTLATRYGGRRTFEVENVDLDPVIDSDGDGNPANDVDLKRVNVYVTWTEVQE